MRDADGNNKTQRYAFMVASALFVAFIGLLGWLANNVAKLDTRISTLEAKVNSHDRIFEQVVSHEQRIDGLETAVGRIEHEHALVQRRNGG